MGNTDVFKQNIVHFIYIYLYRIYFINSKLNDNVFLKLQKNFTFHFKTLFSLVQFFQSGVSYSLFYNWAVPINL